MENSGSKKENITLDIIAEKLGVSKTTVSRVLSGKGRIGAQTRSRVMNYIEEIGYTPNLQAKGLAEKRTYNLAWVIPGGSSLSELPFFQTCLEGIIDYAKTVDYDVVVAMASDEDTSQVRRMLTNRKADGYILSRTLENDKMVALLRESGVPFITIGTCADKNVLQIDSDHRNACRELTSLLLLRGIRRIGLVGGQSTHKVSESRKEGFLEAVKTFGGAQVSYCMYMDCTDPLKIGQAVEEMLAAGTECIIGMDDLITNTVLGILKKKNIDVPGMVKVASFYSSSLLEHNVPAITSLSFDNHKLGAMAAKLLIDSINGVLAKSVVNMGYDVQLKDSTS